MANPNYGAGYDPSNLDPMVLEQLRTLYDRYKEFRPDADFALSLQGGPALMMNGMRMPMRSQEDYNAAMEGITAQQAAIKEDQRMAALKALQERKAAERAKSMPTVWSGGQYIK